MDGRSTGVQKKNQLGRCEDRQQCQDERQHQGQHQHHHQDQYRWQHQGSHRYQESTSTSASRFTPISKVDTNINFNSDTKFEGALDSLTSLYHPRIPLQYPNLNVEPLAFPLPTFHVPFSTINPPRCRGTLVGWKKTMTHYIHSRSSENFD